MPCCKGILDTLSDYLEGDASKSVCNQIEMHLDGCEKCRMHVDTMRAVVTLFKGWRSDEIPDDVSGRLHDAVAGTVDRACKRFAKKSASRNKPAGKPRKKTVKKATRKKTAKKAVGKPRKKSAGNPTGRKKK
jgi:anti-sigma factor RsiW